jgi:hypothetical protein
MRIKHDLLASVGASSIRVEREGCKVSLVLGGLNEYEAMLIEDKLRHQVEVDWHVSFVLGPERASEPPHTPQA